MDINQMQQQMLNNPDLMRSMMDSPMFQNMLNNPEILRQIMQSNPEIQALIERNPELGHVLNDPQTLRQTAELARNPALMQEMLRNQDRAMSNIEAHPEGFNALARMFSEVQNPMMQAVGNAPQTTETPSRAAPSPTPNTEPLPNPWAPRAPTAPAQTAPTPSASPFGDLSPGLFGAAPIDPQQAFQLLQNPAVQTMAQQMAQNPQLMQMMLQSNPMLRQMTEQNPMLAQMLSDPATIQQMFNPEAIQAMMQLSQMFPNQGSFFGSAPSQGAAAGLPTFPQTSTPPAFNFGSLFGSLPTQQPAASLEPPEVRWATQIKQLEDMGFYDRQSNIEALRATNGNVHAAVERLLNSL